MHTSPPQPPASTPRVPAARPLLAAMGTSFFVHTIAAATVLAAAFFAVDAPAPVETRIHISPVTLQTAYVPQALLNAVEPPEPEPVEEPEPEVEQLAQPEPTPPAEPTEAAPAVEDEPAALAAAPEQPENAIPADPVRLEEPPEAEATGAPELVADPVVTTANATAPVVPSAAPTTASLTPPGANQQPGATGDGTGTAATPVAAAEPGDGLSDAARERLMNRWRSSLDRCLSRAARYPADRDIRRQRLEGNVYVSIQFNPDGSFEQVGVARSSGHDALDSWALEQVRDIGRCSEPPTELGADATRVNVPLQYRVG